MCLFLGHLGVTNEEKLKFGIYARNYVRKRSVCAKMSFDIKSSVINNWSIIKSIISQWREEGRKKRHKLQLGEFL